jgi:hypothetical protein
MPGPSTSEGAEAFGNLLLIVDDLAATLTEAGCSGEITCQPTRASPLDDQLGTFALTTVGASPVPFGGWRPAALQPGAGKRVLLRPTRSSEVGSQEGPGRQEESRE